MNINEVERIIFKNNPRYNLTKSQMQELKFDLNKSIIFC